MPGAPTPRSHWFAPSGNSYPVVDATEGLLTYMTEEDIANGVRLDPCGCAITQSFKRTANSPDAMIGGTVAYVVLKTGGRYLCHRFLVPMATRRAVDDFDATGDMPTEVLALRPVPKSNRLDSQRAKDKRKRERWAEAGKVRDRKNTTPLDPKKRNAARLAKTQVFKRWEKD